MSHSKPKISRTIGTNLESKVDPKKNKKELVLDYNSVQELPSNSYHIPEDQLGKFPGLIGEQLSWEQTNYERARSESEGKIMKSTILVVGGGPVGLLNALSLYKIGLNIILVEKRKSYERPQVLLLDSESQGMIKGIIGYRSWKTLEQARIICEDPCRIKISDLETVLALFLQKVSKNPRGQLLLYYGFTFDSESSHKLGALVVSHQTPGHKKPTTYKIANSEQRIRVIIGADSADSQVAKLAKVENSQFSDPVFASIANFDNLHFYLDDKPQIRRSSIPTNVAENLFLPAPNNAARKISDDVKNHVRNSSNTQNCGSENDGNDENAPKSIKTNAAKELYTPEKRKHLLNDAQRRCLHVRNDVNKHPVQDAAGNVHEWIQNKVTELTGMLFDDWRQKNAKKNQILMTDILLETRPCNISPDQHRFKSTLGTASGFYFSEEITSEEYQDFKFEGSCDTCHSDTGHKPGCRADGSLRSEYNTAKFGTALPIQWLISRALTAFKSYFDIDYTNPSSQSDPMHELIDSIIPVFTNTTPGILKISLETAVHHAQKVDIGGIWYYVFLTGDSSHKTHFLTGSGFNQGAKDVALLVSTFQKKDSTDFPPLKRAESLAVEQYDEEQIKKMNEYLHNVAEKFSRQSGIEPIRGKDLPHQRSLSISEQMNIYQNNNSMQTNIPTKHAITTGKRGSIHIERNIFEMRGNKVVANKPIQPAVGDHIHTSDCSCNDNTIVSHASSNVTGDEQKTPKESTSIAGMSRGVTPALSFAHVVKMQTATHRAKKRLSALKLRIKKCVNQECKGDRFGRTGYCVDCSREFAKM